MNSILEALLLGGVGILVYNKYKENGGTLLPKEAPASPAEKPKQ